LEELAARMRQETRQQVARAVNAVESKKGEDIAILEMDRDSGAFTDFFILCTGTNPRQIQAICDEVERQLSQIGVRPTSREGYNQAEWVLLDYVDFVLHIFSERSRKFYDLERLWKSARRLKPADLAKKPAVRKTVKKTPVRKSRSAVAARSSKPSRTKSKSTRRTRKKT
jgi:ribosome-associated protein